MESSIFLDVLASLQKLFVGYIPAAVLGSLVGYLIGINTPIYQILKRLFQIPHSIPPIALLPIALVVFGDNSEPATVVIVFFGTLWPMIINTAIGMQHFRRQRNNFRAAIFHLFYALKVGIWIAWFTVISTEMLIGPKGLGFVIWNAYKTGNANYIIEVVLYVALIALLLDQLLDFTGNLLSQIVSDGKKPS
ncbi:nitrate transporter [Nodularia sp. NIES-3585]|uniref:nitrate transporter n=1 Tax=Nodularia sp. NIES-3585 TaxID=1973477 RepID=UPI000B5C1CA9|nr:nitrate transporter [Nodularia sp. NIES-3585]GAX38356.1 binding-protein-dependent transport systems inner membrane component [Nodularia sp. NIES-3585]